MMTTGDEISTSQLRIFRGYKEWSGYLEEDKSDWEKDKNSRE